MPLDVANLTAIGNIDSLIVLEFTQNNINTFPNGFFQNLGNLTTFSLSSSPITNWGSVVIPSTLNTLSFSGLYSLTAIPDFFGSASSLLTVSITDCPYIGVMPPSFSALTTVTTFTASGNSMNASLQLPVSISNLDLSQNSMTALPASICNLMNLNILIVSNNLLTILPACLSSLTGMNKIYAQNNQIYTFPDFSKWSSLSDIHFANNALSGTYPYALTQLSSLLNIDLRNNFISGSLPRMTGNYLLGSLYLSNNSFSGVISDDTWSSSPSLIYIDISYNQFSGSVPASAASPRVKTFLARSNYFYFLPDSVVSSGITILDLGQNILTRIPNDSTWALDTSWDKILIDHNPGLAGTPLPMFWYPSNINFYDGLNFSWCGFTGTVPLIDYNANYAFLSLSGNQLNGTLTDSYASFSIGTIELAHNQITGTIPTSIIQACDILDLSYNELTGTIPSFFFGFGNRLSSLIVNNNGLTGTIPTINSDFSVLIANNNFLDLCGGPAPSVDPPTLMSVCDLRNNLNGVSSCSSYYLDYSGTAFWCNVDNSTSPSFQPFNPSTPIVAPTPVNPPSTPISLNPSIVNYPYFQPPEPTPGFPLSPASPPGTGVPSLQPSSPSSASTLSFSIVAIVMASLVALAMF